MMKEPDANTNLTASLRRLHRWRMAVFGLVILAAGITLGVAGTLLVVRPTERRPPLNPRMAAELTSRRMREELDLTPEQVDRIDAILREHFETLEKLREAAWPKISEVFESMKAGVDTVLTEQQRSDWEKYTERLERMFRRGMHRGPGEGFRDRRGPFRGPDGSGPGDERGPRQWRRDRLRPGDGAGPRRGRRDANAVSPPPEPEMERMPPSREPEPNAP